MSGGTGSRRRPKGPACPICGKPGAADTLPFCSERCRRVDLHRWFGEAYVVPGAPAPAEESGDDGEER